MLCCVDKHDYSTQKNGISATQSTTDEYTYNLVTHSLDDTQRGEVYHQLPI